MAFTGEVTTGLVLFVAGLGGMVLSLLVGVIAAIMMRNSKKKLKQRLNEIYKFA